MLKPRIIFILSCLVFLSLKANTQTSIPDLVEDYLDEYDHLFNSLSDTDVVAYDKDQLENNNVKALFLNDEIRIYNDLAVQANISTYSLYDYIEDARKLKNYNIRTRSINIISLKKPKANVDIVVYIKKKVPRKLGANNKILAYKTIDLVFGFKLIKRNRRQPYLKLAVSYLYKDKDKDGIVDFIDDCPNSNRSKKVNTNGCIDEDGDGFFPDASRNGPSYDPNDKNPCSPNLASKYCDSDNDGVPNRSDQCPKTRAGAKVNSYGCTDQDGDGFSPDRLKSDKAYDPNDNNPCRPNRSSAQCDTDKDGVANDQDRCPNTPSKLRRFVNARGCVDQDNDGRFPDINRSSVYYDVKDNDPCIPLINNKTCDCDLDGIINQEDDCECIAGSKSRKNNCNGCPDSDQDGVCDQRDKCPYTKGTKRNGCPRKIHNPISEWAFGFEFGAGFPMFEYKENNISTIDYKGESINTLGYAKWGYNGSFSLAYMPSPYIGFELGLGYMQNPVRLEEIRPLILENLALNNISYTRLTLDSLNTYHYFYPNISMALGYFEEDKFMGFQLKGTIGLLSDIWINNEITGEFTNPVGTSSPDFKYDIGIENQGIFPIYKGSASLYFNLADSDNENTFEIEGSYLFGRYPIEDSYAYDRKINAPWVSMHLLSITAKFKVLFGY